MAYDVERTKKVQEVILSIMKDLHKILTENNFVYYLDAGSVLGAIRHNGFIPWDDDLDIEMPRDQYEKFLKVAPQLLPDHLYLQYPGNEKQYHCMFAKIRLKNSLFEEEINKDKDYPRGIYIDIFPIDNVKKVNALFRFKVKLAKAFKSIFLLRVRTDNLDFKHKLFKPFSYLVPRRFCCWIVKKLSGTKKDTPLRYESLSQYSLEKIVFPKEIFGTPKLHKFEDAEFFIPEKAEEYLKIKYKNYMELPPEEKRGAQHSVVRIEFDYDDSKYFK
ncbi:MAG: phosphorylcholine transferase LicD [Candidatus Coproplasma sp.]